MKTSTRKYLTLFSSIISLIIGILIMSNAIGSMVVVNYILLITLGIIGISKICFYASGSKKRDAWDLVLGILFIIASLMLLTNDTIVTEATIGYVLAALALVIGISRFVTAYSIHKEFPKMPISWFVVSGIIAVLVAICLIAFPIATQVIYIYVIGAFLVAYAIVAFITALTMHAEK